MFSKKDYDYSVKARMEHARNLAQMDHAERCGHRLTIAEVERQNKKIVIKHAVKLLNLVFASTTYEERIGTWQDFRSWVNQYRLEVRYSHLKKMVKIWEQTHGMRKAA